MKKLLTLLFALAVAFSLSMPVFAQEAGGTEPPAKTEKKTEKKKKVPKEKKKKTTKEAEVETTKK
jgi:hypothetical protein